MDIIVLLIFGSLIVAFLILFILFLRKAKTDVKKLDLEISNLFSELQKYTGGDKRY